MSTTAKPWKPVRGEKYEVAAVGNATVKIYRRERETTAGETRFIYEVADYTNGGRRMRGKGDLGEARKEADRIARQLSTGNVTAAGMLAPQAASYGRATELIRKTGDPLELVASRYAEAVEILGGDGSKLKLAAELLAERDAMPDKTVSEVVSELLAEKSEKREKRTLDDLRNRLNRFAKDFAGPIASVTKSDVQQWLDSLQTSERDRVNFRSKIGTLFRWAWRRDYVLTNPVEKTEKPEADNGEVEIYNPAELERLIAAARRYRKEYLPALLIGAFAGLRSAEIERLEWSDINLSRGFITASAKKKGTPSRRLVPIQPNLAQWLGTYANQKGKVWKGTHDQFSDFQEATTAATAVKADKQKGIAAEAPVKWKHNGLRHSFVSYRLAILQDDAKTALEAGNTAQTIHDHYKELVTPEDSRLWFAISPKAPANVLPMRAEAAK